MALCDCQADWKTYPIELKHQYATYNMAQRACKAAEEESQIDTADGLMDVGRQRKRRKPLKFESEDSDVDIPKSGKTRKTKPQVYSSSEESDVAPPVDIREKVKKLMQKNNEKSRIITGEKTSKTPITAKNKHKQLKTKHSVELTSPATNESEHSPRSASPLLERQNADMWSQDTAVSDLCTNVTYDKLSLEHNKVVTMSDTEIDTIDQVDDDNNNILLPNSPLKSTVLLFSEQSPLKQSFINVPGTSTSAQVVSEKHSSVQGVSLKPASTRSLFRKQISAQCISSKPASAHSFLGKQTSAHDMSPQGASSKPFSAQGVSEKPISNQFTEKQPSNTAFQASHNITLLALSEQVEEMNGKLDYILMNLTKIMRKLFPEEEHVTRPKGVPPLPLKDEEAFNKFMDFLIDDNNFSMTSQYFAALCKTANNEKTAVGKVLKKVFTNSLARIISFTGCGSVKLKFEGTKLHEVINCAILLNYPKSTLSDTEWKCKRWFSTSAQRRLTSKKSSDTF